MPQGLAEQILPARGAAQKASASFAEQLEDSPGLSDRDSPTSANLFHEPAHRTKAVKYRYTATGKHLSSPLKGSTSSPERKQNKSKRKLMATSPSHARAKAPGVASTSRKRKASFSPPHGEELLRSFLSSPSPLSSTPTTPLALKKALSPSPALTAKDSTPDPPKRISISKTLSLRSFAPAASKASVLSQPLSPKRKQKKKYKAKTEKDLDAWAIGNSVWVLVNQSGVLAENNKNVDPSGELMWWPAQVVQKQPLRVSLFGDFPSSSSTSRGLCTIFNPSPSNVLSINDDSGAKRFSRATFRLTPLSVDYDDSPPTKKPRLDENASIETRWESAVQGMDKASTLERDGLPALLSSYATAGGSFYDSLDDTDSDTSDLRQSLRNPTTPTLSASAKKSKPRRSRGKGKVDTNGTIPRESSPCPADPTLQIPGELVLALAPRTGSAYWPAQILAHVPARKEQYKVKFLDDEEHVVSRDRFWTSEEEGFVLCALGEWESAVKTTDDDDSGDEGGEYGAEDADVTGPDDATCPLAPPPRAEDFADLSVRAQLAYVKPVLRAILNKEYEPVRMKHEAFMRGGSARLALLKSAGVRGGMDARFVKAIQKAICVWVGASRLKPERLDIENDVIRSNGAEEAATPKAISSEAVPDETLPRDSTEDDKMEGIEGAVVLEDVKNDGAQDGTLDLSTPDKHVEGAQDIEMVVDIQEEPPASLPHANGVALSPLAAKSQLDLLAEVSQAVATEPSLLPSHPEVPRLKVDLPPKDPSPQPSPLTPIPEENQHTLPRRSDPVVCEEFEMLSGVEKLDYCLNVLLPATIQQLLLWRSGERTSPALLSLEEEQKLYDVGARKAVQTDWVDDLMRLRAAQARLSGIDISRKAEQKNAEIMQGGTRSRPRPSRP